MFSVGDEVLVVRAAPSLPEGAVCVIAKVYYSSVIAEWMVDVVLNGHYKGGWLAERFDFSDGKTAVERKIRHMYERQYRKTGYAYLF